MIKIVLLHLSYLGLGMAAVRAFSRNVDYPLLLLMCVSYFVGAFIHILVLHISIIVTITSPVVSWSLLGIGIIALVIHVRYLYPRMVMNVRFKTAHRRSYWIHFVFLILLIPVVYLVSLKLVSVPEISYDSTAFWNLKAKYFFYGEHLWSDAFSNSDRIHPHKNYPLYIPLFTFQHYCLLGSPDDFATKIGTLIYYFVGVLLFFFLVSEWIGWAVGILLVVFLLYSPIYSYASVNGSITSTYADFPLSLVILSTGALFLRYFFSGSRVDLFGSMIFVSSALLIKQEGMVWFVSFLPVAGFGLFFINRKLMVSKWYFFTIPLVVFIFWFSLRRALPPGSDLTIPSFQEIVSLYSVFPTTILSWIKAIIRVDQWGFLIAFIGATFTIGLIRNLRRAINLIIPLALIIYVVGLIISTMLLEAQIGLTSHFIKTLYPRLVLQFLPLAFFLSVTLNSKYSFGIARYQR